MSTGMELIKYVEGDPIQKLKFTVGVDFGMDNSTTIMSTKGEDGWYHVGYNYEHKEIEEGQQ